MIFARASSELVMVRTSLRSVKAATSVTVPRTLAAAVICPGFDSGLVMTWTRD